MTAADLSARVDAVEIKVTIGAVSVDRAAEAFDLRPGTGSSRRIYFCESATCDAGRTPLLDQGLILRVRHRPAKDGDSTVKFRPFDPRRLTGPWRHAHHFHGARFRVEADWVGDRHVVAASIVSDQPPDQVADVLEGTRPVSKLFTRDQEQFLQHYAVERVNLDELRVLGPVQATKWEPRHIRFRHELAAERWKLDELSFLEMSIRVEDPLLADTAQREFEQLMRSRGLLVDAVQETKTRTVLERLCQRG